ncbi:MAG TPA: aldo/keto reductase [Acidobacteriaceae bacterium]|nr:aldo/keto reductase [Acidobacteriaceae bacterium]
MERRTFLQSAAAAAAAFATGHAAAGQQTDRNPQDSLPLGVEFITSPNPNAARLIPRVEHPGTMRGEMLYRKLGTTGVEVSAIGMGGYHLGKKELPEQQAIRLIHQGVDRGINFLDNCWDYNDGNSEVVMGKALAQGGYRQKAFVMTKIDGRTKQAAQQQIEQSLQRLQTDHIDLLQHHEILRFEDPDRVFAEGGAMEAVLEAKQAGKVRFIGFTGHKDPHVHLYMLDTAKRHGFHFDSAQMPLNVMDAHFRSFAQLVVPRLVAEGTGVLAMKTFGDHFVLASKTVEPMECLHYGLNLPVSVVITGIDNEDILNQAFNAVKTFKPMDEQQVAAILAKTQSAALTGKFEPFKTTTMFDGTAHHPEYLG